MVWYIYLKRTSWLVFFRMLLQFIINTGVSIGLTWKWVVQKQPSKGVQTKIVLKICNKFAGEHLYRIVILIKLQRSITLLGPQPSVAFNFLRPPAQISFSQPLTMELSDLKLVMEVHKKFMMFLNLSSILHCTCNGYVSTISQSAWTS